MRIKEMCILVAVALLFILGSIGAVVFAQNSKPKVMTGKTTKISQSKGKTDKDMADDTEKDISNDSKQTPDDISKTSESSVSEKPSSSFSNVGNLPQFPSSIDSSSSTLGTTSLNMSQSITDNSNQGTITSTSAREFKIEYPPIIYKKVGEDLSSSEISSSIVNPDTKEVLTKYVTLSGEYYKEVAGEYEVNFVISIPDVIEDFTGKIKIVYL